jgi:hypothetical protein
LELEGDIARADPVGEIDLVDLGGPGGGQTVRGGDSGQAGGEQKGTAIHARRWMARGGKTVRQFDPMRQAESDPAFGGKSPVETGTLLAGLAQVSDG